MRACELRRVRIPVYTLALFLSGARYRSGFRKHPRSPVRGLIGLPGFSYYLCARPPLPRRSSLRVVLTLGNFWISSVATINIHRPQTSTSSRFHTSSIEDSNSTTLQHSPGRRIDNNWIQSFSPSLADHLPLWLWKPQHI